MAGAAAPETQSQADFARRRGVSRKTVTKWKEQGLLALDGAGRVKVDETEWNLDQRPATNRGGVAHRPVRTVPKEGADPRERPVPAAGKPPPPPTQDVSRPSEGDDGDGEIDLDGENLTHAEAARRKENFLGLLRRQEFHSKSGSLIDRAAVESLFFTEARDLRDAWLAWPARVAIVMADELKIDPRMLTTVLTAHVRKHLDELGEPEADLPGPQKH